MSRGPDSALRAPLPASSEESVRAALVAVLESRTFARSSRLRSLLAYIVEKSIADESESLKEYALGVEVFGRTEDFDPRLDTIVRVECRRLRLRLEDYYRTEGSADPVRIELRRGSYAATFSRSVPASAAEPPPAVRSRKSIRWSLGVVPLVAAAAMLWWGSAVHSPPSVAILPFSNLTAQPPDEVLSQGLADEVIDILTRNDGLRTIARGSSRRAMRPEAGPREAGKQLGVENVVAGNIRREGARVRITAQLVRVSDGASLWSRTYERESASPFDIEDELSRSIAEGVAGRLGATQAAGRRPYVPSPAASRIYLQGRYLWNQRTPASVRESIRYFEEAVGKDPRFALAHAALADSWAVLAMNEQAPVADAAARAKSAASAALHIDPSLGEARATAAWLRFFHDWEFASAEKEFERAIQLRPRYATAHQWFGLALLARGRFDRAVQEFEKALEMDPLSLIVLTDIAVARYYQRRYDLALEGAREALRLDSGFHYAKLILGAALLQTGRGGEALDAMRSAVAASGREPDCLMRLGHALALQGQAEEARKVLAELDQGGTHHQRAFVCTGLGRHSEALDHLEESLKMREPSLLLAALEPAFDPLRKTPRFQALLRAAQQRPSLFTAALPEP